MGRFCENSPHLTLKWLPIEWHHFQPEPFGRPVYLYAVMFPWEVFAENSVATRCKIPHIASVTVLFFATMVGINAYHCSHIFFDNLSDTFVISNLLNLRVVWLYHPVLYPWRKYPRWRKNRSRRLEYSGWVTPSPPHTTPFSWCVDISYKDDLTVHLLLGVSFMTLPIR